MNFLKKSGLLFVAVMIAASYAGAQAGDLAPLGFQFGISKKDAIKVIDSHGKRVIENKVDSKKIRTILMQGAIVDLPLDTTGLDMRTGLEFYDKKLLSTSLIFFAGDSLTEAMIEERFSNYFLDLYGEPSERDSMMYFKTWAWQMPEVKLVLHTNTKDNIVKIDYTYKPINRAKYEEELDQKRGTEKIDPAKQMFLDGDYSKPTDYDDRYKAPTY